MNVTINIDDELKTFDIPNEITLAAIEEGHRIADDINIKGYKNISDLKAALENEV